MVINPIAGPVISFEATGLSTVEYHTEMKRVLLIDDDPVTNFIHERLIQEAGVAAEVMVATNGRQGLDVLTETIRYGTAFPDLIILDINIPIMDGFEFLIRLGEIDPASRGFNIVIASSSNNKADRSRASELGITNFLVKPVSFEALADLLT